MTQILQYLLVIQFTADYRKSLSSARQVHQLFQVFVTNFATVCHRVMRFSAKCSERNCLLDKGQCL